MHSPLEKHFESFTIVGLLNDGLFGRYHISCESSSLAISPKVLSNMMMIFHDLLGLV